MARKPEQQLWDSVRAGATAIRGLKLTRIETGSTSDGVPDVFYQNKTAGYDGWIELKVHKLRKCELTGEPLKIDHFTAIQRKRLLDQWQCRPGSGWLLLRLVGPSGSESHHLIASCDAFDVGRTDTLKDVERKSIGNWHLKAVECLRHIDARHKERAR